jgi:type II secretory pathway component HofQ
VDRERRDLPVPPGRKVTLDLREIPFRQALEALFQGTGEQYAVEPSVPNTPISLRIRDVDFVTALRALVRLAGVTYRREVGAAGGLYIIGTRPEPVRLAAPIEVRAPAPVEEKRFSLDLRDVPIRQALAELFRLAERQYAIEPGVPNIPVTLNVRDVDFTTALRALVRLAGLTYRREGPLYMVGTRPALEP